MREKRLNELGKRYAPPPPPPPLQSAREPSPLDSWEPPSTASVVALHVIVTVVLFGIAAYVLEIIFVSVFRPQTWLLWWLLSFASAVPASWISVWCSASVLRRRLRKGRLRGGQPFLVTRVCLAVFIVLAAIGAIAGAGVDLGNSPFPGVDALLYIAYFAMVCTLVVVFSNQYLRTLPQIDDRAFPAGVNEPAHLSEE